MKLDKAAVFLDTNFFYDYNEIKNINWLSSLVLGTEVLRCQSVTLVIAPVVLREISDHKYSGRKPALAERAASVIRQINGYLLATPEGNLFPVNEDVELLLESRDAEVRSPRNHYVGDDQLLENMLLFIEENPGVEVFLHTNDTEFKVKARMSGIRHVALPDRFRSPERADPRDRKIRELEKLVKDLNDAKPPEPCISVTLRKSDVGGVWTTSSEEINLAPGDFFSRLVDLPIFEFPDERSHRNLAPRSALVQIIVENNGTAPANDLIFKLSSKTVAFHQSRYLGDGYSDQGRYVPESNGTEIDHLWMSKKVTLLRHAYKFPILAIITFTNEGNAHSIEWSCYAHNLPEKAKGSLSINLLP